MNEPTTVEGWSKHWLLMYKEYKFKYVRTAKILEAAEQDFVRCVGELSAQKMLYDAALLDLLEVRADLSAERRVSYTIQESLTKAEETIKAIGELKPLVMMDDNTYAVYYDELKASLKPLEVDDE